MQARIAINAPLLRLMGNVYGSALQDIMSPSSSQLQTCIVRVPVLLKMGLPLSSTKTGM